MIVLTIVSHALKNEIKGQQDVPDRRRQIVRWDNGT
jgi:hypothetical protein